MSTNAIPADVRELELKLDLDADWPRGLPGEPSRPPSEDGAEGSSASAAHRPNGLTLSRLLHGLGALVIVAAFIMYLFQGWRDGDDLTRCLLLLIHTVVLTMAGFASGHVLREAKGARLFIALALAAVPVSFAFLGGVTYPHLTWDAPRTLDAAATLWQPSLDHTLAFGPALMLTGAATAILAGAIWIGFLVMARRSAGALTGLYLLANAALLLPTRDDLVISAVLLVLAGALALGILRLRRGEATLATPEGRFARAVLTLPLLVIAGRSLWLWAPDTLFFATLSLVGYLAARLALSAHDHGPERPRSGLLEAMAVLLAGSSTLFLFATLAELDGLADVAILPLAMGLFTLLLLDMARQSGARSGRYEGAAALTAGLTMLVNLSLWGGFFNALVCLGVGLLILAYGFGTKRRGVFAVGLIGALSGLGVMAHAALADFTIGGWTALVLLGVATIVSGSLLERHGAHIRAMIGQWSRHFEQPA